MSQKTIVSEEDKFDSVVVQAKIGGSESKFVLVFDKKVFSKPRGTILGGCYLLSLAAVMIICILKERFYGIELGLLTIAFLITWSSERVPFKS